MITKLNFIFLLFTLVTISCITNKKSEFSTTESQKIYKGYFGYGHESSSFRPINSAESYWVLGNSISKHTDSLYQALKGKDYYSEIYVEMTGTLDTTSIRDGFAYDYDGLFSIDSIHYAKKFDKQKIKDSYTNGDKRGQCFEYYDKNKGKVVSQLELRINNNQFEGLFGWDDGETDNFYGTLKNGWIDGQLFFAEYHYTTEGEAMVQEVVFKQIQQGYLQGDGELYEDYGVYRIDRSKEIDFATGLFFRKTDCP